MLQQVRTSQIEALGGEVLSLNQLLIRTNAPVRGRRERQLTTTGLIGDDCTSEPATGRSDTPGEPVRHALTRLRVDLLLELSPDHAEVRL